jgi:hypothetical protein
MNIEVLPDDHSDNSFDDAMNKVEGNHIMHQETKRDGLFNASRKKVCELKKIVHKIFTQSGCGSTHAIMIAASHACSCEPTAKPKAPQVILLLTLVLTLLTHVLFLLRKNSTQSELSY